MPIYEFYCPDNHKIYQFYAKTLAQGQTVPKCPDNPKFRLQKLVSKFAITKGLAEPAEAGPAGEEGDGDDARMEAAMAAMEGEFAHADENDPKAMGRMMRRMAELTGERLDGEMEEVVRKLEEGTDPDELEEMMGGPDGGGDDDMGMGGPDDGPPGEGAALKEARHRFRALQRQAPERDPKLYDYE